MRHRGIIIFFSIFNAIIAVLTLEEKRAGPIQFDCGRIKFDEGLILEAIQINISNKKDVAHKFTALLYDGRLDYRMLPVPCPPEEEMSQFTIFYIIIDQSNNLVDVVAQMRNGHYIKCKRIDSLMLEPPQIEANKESNYECGHELFTHETLISTVAEGASRIGQNGLYPLPYDGKQYNSKLKLWIYPILRGNKVHQVSRIPESTYFAVFTEAGKLIDVIAKLSNNFFFMRCSRTTKKLDATEGQELQVGYLCDSVFFNMKYLKKTADLAKEKMESKKTSGYPKRYNGPPLQLDLWTYPLFANGQFYIKGSLRVKYLVVMDKLFNVKFVGIKTPGGLQPCPETSRGITSISPETDDFLCDQKYFPNHHLKATVARGCKALGTRNRNYPAKYEGPDFSIPGPYFTWPLFLEGMYKYAPGRFRAVMTPECLLAGVIVKMGQTFHKCRRRSDKSIPGENSTMLIREIHSIPKRQKNKHPRLLPLLDDI